jgi:hypothetical protein
MINNNDSEDDRGRVPCLVYVTIGSSEDEGYQRKGDTASSSQILET